MEWMANFLWNLSSYVKTFVASAYFLNKLFCLLMFLSPADETLSTEKVRACFLSDNFDPLLES